MSLNLDFINAFEIVSQKKLHYLVRYGVRSAIQTLNHELLTD